MKIQDISLVVLFFGYLIMIGVNVITGAMAGLTGYHVFDPRPLGVPLFWILEDAIAFFIAGYAVYLISKVKKKQHVTVMTIIFFAVDAILNLATPYSPTLSKLAQNLMLNQYPVWYEITLLLVIVPSTLFGGWVASRLETLSG